VDTYIAGQLQPIYFLENFFESILLDLDNNLVQGSGDNGGCLLWDNLYLHKTAYVIHVIEGPLSFNRIILVDRPPYRQKIAPIKYVFCEVAAEFSRRVKRRWNI